MQRFLVNVLLCILVSSVSAGKELCAQELRVQEGSAQEGSEGTKSRETAGSWTGGGHQFWSDLMVYGSWRIQRNVYTSHSRLLDPMNRRHTWGSFSHCHRKFTELKNERSLPPLKREAVVTLHGLGRTRDSMAGLGKYLAEHGDYSWINVSYASTRGRVESHAEALASVVRQLEGVETVHFVGHSMGNLVIRHYLTNRERTSKATASESTVAESSPSEKAAELPTVGRVVMLAPPNNGSHLAERLKDNEIYRVAAGVSGSQLATEWDELNANLGTPSCEFGIIAGKASKRVFSNPLLTGDDDLVVTVEETKLAGASDFLVVSALHTFIMNDSEVRDAALRFLQHGYFQTEEKRNALERNVGDANSNSSDRFPRKQEQHVNTHHESR
ncbi:MAG: alpha/beta hydrolase [Planctomycetota bacterium]